MSRFSMLFSPTPPTFLATDVCSLSQNVYSKGVTSSTPKQAASFHFTLVCVRPNLALLFVAPDNPRISHPAMKNSIRKQTGILGFQFWKQPGLQLRSKKPAVVAVESVNFFDISSSKDRRDQSAYIRACTFDILILLSNLFERITCFNFAQIYNLLSFSSSSGRV